MTWRDHRLKFAGQTWVKSWHNEYVLLNIYSYNLCFCPCFCSMLSIMTESTNGSSFCYSLYFDKEHSNCEIVWSTQPDIVGKSWNSIYSLRRAIRPSEARLTWSVVVRTLSDVCYLTIEPVSDKRLYRILSGGIIITETRGYNTEIQSYIGLAK